MSVIKFRIKKIKNELTKNTYIKSISTLLSFFILVTTLISGQIDFGAYYTKVAGISNGANLGRYADIIAIVGPGKQLEFTRATAYMPVWRTPSGTYNISSIITRENDPDFLYTYVRLLQNNPDKIVVQLRYYESVSKLSKNNDDPLNPYGITGIVLETFTINRDNRVIRTIKRATGTRYEDWINPALAITQTITLRDDGISEGPVNWGASPPILPRPPVSDNPVKKPRGLPRPVKKWTFDEGLTTHNDEVIESIDDTPCPIDGLMTEYFPGVSGTALAFDGYYSGVRLPAANRPALSNAMAVEAWVTLDNYPYNDAPFIHNSTGTDGIAVGEKGWYLGVDAYGKPFFRINGVTAKSPDSLAVNRWTHIVGTYDGSNMRLYVDAVQKATAAQTGNIHPPDDDLMIGRNNTKLRTTEKVRGDLENLPFLYGIEGLIDQVCIYNTNLSETQIKNLYAAFLPANRASPINSGVLPGQTGAGTRFGASYTELQWQALWDKMWRDDNPDILVKFDDKPISIIFWRGTNYSPNLVTENNIWYNDQSCETGNVHGCAEHMSDKQRRQCITKIIENTAARVVVHWRYPLVDIGYTQGDLVDEYYTIYPDGTMVRNVLNCPTGFQDTQILLAPGQDILDVINLQSNTIMNLSGSIQSLTWTPPKGMPSVSLADPRIELLNTKSTYKPFLIFRGGRIYTWGIREVSPYSSLPPYAGPWDHYPVSLVPSDGRFAVNNTRIRHFAGFGSNDSTPSQVLYGLTSSPISGLLDLAKMFNSPPVVRMEKGAISSGFNVDDKSYVFTAIENESIISFTIDASINSPLINPCFVIRNWGASNKACLKINGVVQNEGPNFRQGKIIDLDGTYTMILWVGGISATSPQKFEITRN